MAIIHFKSKDLEAAFVESKEKSYLHINANYMVQTQAYAILSDLDAITCIDDITELPAFNHDVEDGYSYCAVITVNGAEPCAAITFVCVYGDQLIKAGVKADIDIEADRLYKIEVQLHINEP